MINEIIISVAVLFFPGVLWAKIETLYGSQINRGYKELMINAFLFNIVIYVFLRIVYFGWNREFDILQISKIIKTGSLVEIQDEFAFAWLTSLVFSLGWLYVNKYRLIPRSLRCIKASDRDQRTDVWTMVHSTNLVQYRFVRLLDQENQNFVEGYVVAYSEQEDTRELLLEDVTILDFDCNPLYECPMFYISRMRDKISLEFPYEKENQND